MTNESERAVDASRPQPAGAARVAAVTAALVEHMPRLHAAWGAHVPEDAFATYVAERVPLDASLPEAISGLALEDLYLACACARGDAAAIAALDRAMLGNLELMVARVRRNVAADEVKQRMLQELFVPSDGAPPGITRYSGRGALGGWLRVVAARAAGKIDRSEPRHAPLDEGGALADGVSGADDPETAYIRERFRQEFAAAFAQAIDALPAADRLLLKQHFVDGLSIDELGLMHGVHRATAARWLAKVRADVAEGTRQRVLAAVGHDAQSVFRAVQSQLDVSIRGVLRGV